MIAAKIKSITVCEIFAKVPSVKKELWGGEFWTDGYFVSTVSEHTNEDVIRYYVRNQCWAGEYKLLHKQQVIHHEQLTLF
jgi:putative transposase